MTAPRPAWIKPLAALAFAGLTALSAQIDVPMHPVPMTMQSWAVLLAGAALGLRWGVLSVAAYLAAAAAGLPVLAEGGAGLAPFSGPTAGYLVAFPLAAGLMGWMADQGVMRTPLAAWGAAVVGHLVLLGLGAAWLATFMGWGPAAAAGFAPFLIGAVAKSLLVTACLPVVRRLVG